MDRHGRLLWRFVLAELLLLALLGVLVRHLA
jgi:hypothetical protein